jgi:hypothetical protein
MAVTVGGVVVVVVGDMVAVVKPLVIGVIIAGMGVALAAGIPTCVDGPYKGS